MLEKQTNKEKDKKKSLWGKPNHIKSSKRMNIFSCVDSSLRYQRITFTPKLLKSTKQELRTSDGPASHPASDHIPMGHVMALRSKIQNITELIEAYIFILKGAGRVSLFCRLTLRRGRVDKGNRWIKLQSKHVCALLRNH